MSFHVDMTRSTTPIVCKGICASEQQHYLGSYKMTEAEPLMLAIACMRCSRVTLTGAPIQEKPCKKQAA